jgi:chloramphenicol 3-O phosphotransferase
MSVIFLNGCTSSGKSSLARALQARLPGLWLVTGIDHAISTAPARLHHHPDGFKFDRDDNGLVRLTFGREGRALLAAHRRAASAMATGETGVILDEVLAAPDMLEAWLKALSGLEVWMVGLHCTLIELERREIARGDRVLGQARGQFDRVHRGVIYDVELDSTAATAERLAHEVIDAMASLRSPRAFAAMCAEL